ncbi:L-asparaginase [Ereboglobus sp. PH5-5]|uniref:asparaginase domain-containing protein n=1 Tax=unclassified Ereboglobus TaxID=2626932 RepID=UPI002406CEBA|nr:MULTISPECIES: asparaginase domain-containing protein [unclassified Ereboglobus]MDF9828045.1 L-asparaginase [Ereboglobus sp. PH5-10]MDF9832261.1 L-asparaginase [Ereboglobus sp. PH5-5]
MQPIAILTTGGTIDKVYYDALSKFSVGAPALPRCFQEANINYEVSVREICRKDSLDMTDDDRARLRAAALARPESRLLVTHGTDTMTKSAEALRDIPGKTIVFVGAMQPAHLRETDAPFNLGFATAAVQLLPPGVYIAMNGQVFPAGTVRKNREAGRFEPA